MLPINQYLTIRNYTKASNKNNKYLVIHFVGAVSSALNNAKYFYSTYRGASAHYFVDDNNIYQVVADKDIAWHCGANSYKHKECRNTNSIGIEMCCYNKNGTLDMSDKVIANTIELAASICKKYNIPMDRVLRHYDVTGKNCPAPFVKDSSRWIDFKNRLSKAVNGSSEVVNNNNNTTMNKTMYVTANDGLNVRKGAGTNYKVIKTLKKGTKVTVYTISNNWGRIGKDEWVSMAYLSEKVPTTETKTMYVKVSSTLRIRIGAGTQYRTTGYLNNGNKVTVYEEKNGWSKIGDAQWVNSSYLVSKNPVSNVKYVTANGGLNVRKGAGTNYKVVKTLPKGASVTVYETKNGWSRIGKDQWVSSAYIK